MTQLPLLPAPVLAWLADPMGAVASVAPLAPGVWWWAVARAARSARGQSSPQVAPSAMATCPQRQSAITPARLAVVWG